MVDDQNLKIEKKLEEAIGADAQAGKTARPAEKKPEQPLAGIEKGRAFELAPFPREQAQAQKKSAAEAAGRAGRAAAGGLEAARKQRQKRIEDILAKDLEEVYLNIAPAKQREFKEAGEDASRKISLLLEKAKLKVEKIINLIRKWLLIIPGINRFFLEQEAKIKADEIIKLKNGESK